MVTLNNYINEALLFLKPYEAELKYNYSYGMLQGNAKKYQLVKGPMENSKVSIQELANNFNQSRRNAMADIDKCLLTLAPNHHNLNAPAEV
jgi:transcriptional antiterminator